MTSLFINGLKSQRPTWLRQTSKSVSSVRVASTTPEILVEIDADRIRTVIRNLLENAINYSLPDSRAVEVSAAQNGEYVVIRVTDDGPGIPEGDIPSLFEPFFRVDRSRSGACVINCWWDQAKSYATRSLQPNLPKIIVLSSESRATALTRRS